MDSFPPNSHKSKEEPEPKKIERITTGEVILRKTPITKKIRRTFLKGDMQSVWQYVAFDVLLPAAKETFLDALNQGSERLVFGEARSASRRTGFRPPTAYGRVDYQGYSRNTPREHRPEPRMSQRARATHDFGEIVLATRVEAEEVIARMYDLLERYQQVTVSDLYDIVGVSGNYPDLNWGWTDLRGSEVVRITEGYLLDLPRPVSLS